MPNLAAVFRSLRESPRFAASVLLTLAAGCGVALALLGFAGAGIGYTPPTLFPTWDRGATGPGWTESLGTVAAMRHAGIVALLSALRGATMMVLASACVVAATLVLGRGVARRQTITLRVVLGAAPIRIFREVMADAGALVIAGCALGLTLGVAVARGLGASWPGDDPWARAVPGGWAVAMAIGIPLAVLMACALTPFFGAFRRDLAARLTTGDRATAGRYEGWFRRILTIAQFAMSMALLVGAGTLIRGSLPAAASAGSSFDPRDTLTLDVTFRAASSPQRAAQLGAALERVRALPGVRAASAASADAWLGLGPEDAVTAICNPACADPLIPFMPMLHRRTRHAVVSPGYFAALGVPVAGGREFAPTDGAGAEPVAIVSRSAGLRLFPRQDPVGQRVLARHESSLVAGLKQGAGYRVIGVVEEVRARGPGVGEEPMPLIYLSALQHPPRVAALAVRVAGDPLRAADAVEGAIRSVALRARVDNVMTMEERLARFAAPLGWGARVIGGVAALAVILACGGLFGVVAEGVERRGRE
ncbi:MAG TPA: ABC transporter permease, partial [Longimicrobium sp.]|nr:ABC transporter permease [Longimicrobium sp.]